MDLSCQSSHIWTKLSQHAITILYQQSLQMGNIQPVARVAKRTISTTDRESHKKKKTIKVTRSALNKMIKDLKINEKQAMEMLKRYKSIDLCIKVHKVSQFLSISEQYAHELLLKNNYDVENAILRSVVNE